MIWFRDPPIRMMPRVDGPPGLCEACLKRPWFLI